MVKILVVDDEQRIRTAIREYAQYEGWSVDEAEDGLQAIEKVRGSNYDIVVLDIMMPKLDGFSTCKEIRKLKKIPVLMLSARGEEYDKLFGFELGVDDYVVKPFSGKELMARIRVIVSRHHSSANNEKPNDSIQLDGLEIDFRGRRVLVDNQEISLTPKEYDLLFFFVRNPNTAFSREELLSKVWGYDYDGYDRTVDTHIKTLRSNLGDYRDHIVTLRGMGYKFESET